MKDRTILIWSAAIGITAAVFPVFQRLVLLPLYISHNGESLFLSLLNRVSTMVVLPGKVVVYRVWPPPEHHFTTPQMFATVPVTFCVYFLLVVLIWGGAEKIWRFKVAKSSHPADEPQQPIENVAASPERRAFLATAVSGAAGVSIVVSGTYPLLVEPGWLHVRRERVPLKGLPKSLNGFTIAQLTDLHHDEWISLDHIRDAIRVTNRLKSDLVALTGDYVTSNPSLIKNAVRALRHLNPRVGTVAVLGNHDWWSDVQETRRRFAEVEIPLIDNKRLFVSPDRKRVDTADAGICIGGVGDLWEDDVSPEKAFEGIPNQMPRILLSHNPDVAEDHRIVRHFPRVDLMLCGHTHGGQVYLPGLGTPIVPSAYGPKYAQGLVKGPGCLVQVSAGIGMAMLPVRLNVRPEIVLITLESA